MAFNSLVRPQVEYTSAVWSPYTKENINKIEKVQRRAARWVSNDYSSYSSVTDMLSNLGWQSLENRRTDKRLAMFYKIVYGLVAIPLSSYFEHAEVYTRHMHSLLTDRFTHLSVTINTPFSLYPLFFGTSYQLISSWFLILTPLNQESARSIIHTLKCILIVSIPDLCTMIYFNSILLKPNTIIFIFISLSFHYLNLLFLIFLTNTPGACKHPDKTQKWIRNYKEIDRFSNTFSSGTKIRKKAKIRNLYNQIPHPTYTPNGKVTKHKKTSHSRGQPFPSR